VRLSANGGIPPAGGCGKLAKPMGLRTYTPPPPLDRFVDVLWLYKGYQPAHAHSKERLMPDGSVALVINLRDDVTRIYDRNHLEKCHTMPGAILCGVHTECFVIDTKEQADVVGVQFRPGGAFPFLGLPPGETHNLHVPLDALWGSLAKEVRERLLGARSETETFQILESMLLARARGALDRHPAVAFALKEFQGVRERGRTNPQAILPRAALPESFALDSQRARDRLDGNRAVVRILRSSAFYT
jgi:hypothetical protein